MFDFTLPLKVNAMVLAESGDDNTAVNFYLRTSLIPRLRVLSGKISLYVKGSIAFVSFSKSVTFAEFGWLLDYSMPNLLPIKPLKVNLMYLNYGIDFINKEGN